MRAVLVLVAACGFSPSGKWALVRDPAPLANEPNWYFVHRGCVSIANTD